MRQPRASASGRHLRRCTRGHTSGRPAGRVEKLDVKGGDGSLTIEAESVVSVPPNLALSHAEVRVPYFSRRFTVSEEFDTPRIEAALKDGVLRLTIQRREEAKPRRIDVGVG
jgi:HSP20 family molecular chaperone IbpA